MRRVERSRAEGSTLKIREAIHIAELGIDPATRRVHQRGELVHLTPTEFDLVLFLAESPGAVYSREDLLEQVWGYAIASGVRTVDSHIRALRRKLGNDVIRTVHGVGYALEDAA